MRGGTLFSGIGAPEVSAPWIDWRWSADIDDFANAVRAHHWPEVPNLGDVAAIRDPEPVDIIGFGSPCQSFSVAGKRLGLDDPRGNLALVALALVARVRPRWIVFENVPGLLSSDDGRDFGLFLRAVDECGYQCAWRVLDAQYFGLAQRRRRVFLVGYPGDWRPPAAVLLEPESLRWNPPPRREAGEIAPVCIGDGAEGSGWSLDLENLGDGGNIGYRPGSDSSITLNTNANIGFASTGNLSHCLNAGGMGGQDYETETLVAFSCKDHGADAGGTSPTLRAMGHDGSHANGGGQVAVAMAYGLRSDAGREGVAKTPSADAEGRVRLRDPGFNPLAECAPTVDAGQPHSVAYGPMVRRLTPTECERLMGFPDGWTDIPWRGGKAPDGRRYRALGNSMAVPCISWILDRIRLFDEMRAAA